MAKNVLGKGLQALLSDLPESRKVMELTTDLLKPNPFQPRTVFNEEMLNDLASSIQEHGMIQPIVAVKSDSGYQIVAGERRWRAAKLLGLEKVPVLVQDYEQSKLLEIALIENLQREDLNPIEVAVCYQRLLDELSFTQDELAKRVGKSRTAVTNALRLLKLPEVIKNYVSCETLSGGHAKAILGLKESEQQIALAERVIREGLSVRQTEELVKIYQADKNKSRAKKQPLSAEFMAIEDRLKNFFGTKVAIHQGKKKGRIEIEYYSSEDLERILSSLSLTED